MAAMNKVKIHYFYVLYCNDGTLYGGYTTNLFRREAEHNTGRGAKYTRPVNRRPAQMIYAEKHETRSLASKAEFHFKKLTRQKKEKYLKEQGVQLPIVLKKQENCIIIEKRNEVKTNE